MFHCVIHGALVALALGVFAAPAQAYTCECPDVDYDGVCDVDDNCPYVANPYQEDADYDYVGDVCDNCVYDANSYQEDADYDGVGDVCECADYDYDGVCDVYDLCPETDLYDDLPDVGLRVNRWADIDGDGVFETRKQGGGYGEGYTIEDTAGCTCAQIVDELYLGLANDHYGCSRYAMETWIYLVE